MPTDWNIALRFLREGRMQTLLIIAGVTVGVAVVVFITARLGARPPWVAAFVATWMVKQGLLVDAP